MKNLLTILATTLALTSVASADEVLLVSRSIPEGSYQTATYSFKHMTQGNLDLTHNNWEILFEGRKGFTDYFRVNTVVDDYSFIFDLGEKSCRQILSTASDERETRPMVWLAYSEAHPSNLKPGENLPVKVNHCYLSYNTDDDGLVVALFHVKAHDPARSVIIDEIEVLHGRVFPKVKKRN